MGINLENPATVIQETHHGNTNMNFLRHQNLSKKTSLRNQLLERNSRMHLLQLQSQANGRAINQTWLNHSQDSRLNKDSQLNYLKDHTRQALIFCPKPTSRTYSRCPLCNLKRDPQSQFKIRLMESTNSSIMTTSTDKDQALPSQRLLTQIVSSTERATKETTVAQRRNAYLFS